MAKITRKAIKEGLSQIPMETILLGIGKETKLTHKQKEFARKVALGSPKTKAYRETYNTKASAKVVGVDASKLASNPSVSLEIEAYKVALETEKHRTPAQLKSLLIQQLVKHSLDEDFPPAQRVKCLELMGKLYEVGAFEERKTTTIVHESAKVKERLLSQLKSVMNGNYISEIQIDEGDELLSEIRTDPPGEGGIEQPTTPPPAQTGPSAGQPYIHTIPHNESALKTTEPDSEKNMLVTTSSKSSSQDVDYIEESKVTGTLSSENSEGGIAPKGENVTESGTNDHEKEGTPHENCQEVVLGEDIEMTPLDNMDKKWGGGIKK
jgi:predicted outer membrane protein